MTPKPSPTTGVNLEEELARLREAVQNLELFEPETDPLNALAYLGDIEQAAGRARGVLEGRLA
jgi:hypothetical protein